MSNNPEVKKKFKSSIRRSTGESYLILSENPSIDFSDDIIQDSLKNFAYDGQCERSRAYYLFEIILLSKQHDKIRKALLNALASEQDNRWTLIQLFNFANNFLFP